MSTNYHISQINVQSYYFELTISDTSKPTIIEIKIDASKSKRANYHDLPPIFGARKEKQPEIEYDADGKVKTFFSDYFDSNGFYGQKNYLYVKIPKTENGESQNWFLIMHVPMYSTYVYDIQASQSSLEQCPQNCMSDNVQKGYCVQGECQCYDNRIDEDCGIEAPLLHPEIKKSLTVSIDDLTYFYYEMPDDATYINSDIQLEITKYDDSSLILYTNLGLDSQLSYVPTNLWAEAANIVSEKESEFLIPNQYLIKDNETKKITFALQCLENKNVGVDLKITVIGDEDNGNSNTTLMIVYFVLSIVGFILLVWIILTIIRIKNKNQMAQQQLQLQVQAMRRRNIQQQSQFLTKEEIDKYLPSISFLDLKKQHSKKIEDGESCSVCLLEFENSSMVRSTPCNHLFCQECLESWLKKHDNCPLCREELSKKKLKEMFKLNQEGKKTQKLKKKVYPLGQNQENQNVEQQNQQNLQVIEIKSNQQQNQQQIQQQQQLQQQQQSSQIQNGNQSNIPSQQLQYPIQSQSYLNTQNSQNRSSVQQLPKISQQHSSNNLIIGGQNENLDYQQQQNLQQQQDNHLNDNQAQQNKRMRNQRSSQSIRQGVQLQENRENHSNQNDNSNILFQQDYSNEVQNLDN
ncbi:hypothetical protein PPERSA_07338 [Pseudocohnilembus persalinus]|uniref:RING-type domain-containing protein n=1 Tax=Pseudocohnilembus persalinus TaxID=266149 RepID=A0A0V0QA21_PSEPJ|nr:hypothetical protein PPERSA_07338 [Pseudocohnilembus persalinus]|eukprot:KRW99085.1 hypothetical protein PPERSA_07338 [Pseudocohnilembus persalinus]